MKQAHPDKPSDIREAKSYAYYSGLGFQMIATIGICCFIGYRIDQSKSGEVGIYTAICSLIGVCISLYYTIRSVLNRNHRGDK